MNRSLHPNPALEGASIQRLQLNDAEFKDWVENTGIHNPPAGFRACLRVSGNVLEWSLEKIPAGGAGAVVAPVGGDQYDGMSLADLQTWCGRKGIKYGKDDGKTTLIQALRKK